MTTTRYYLVNGEFHTYDWLHDNLGYTKTATTSVTYKTTDPWGGTASSSGYSDHPSGVYDFDQFSFFVSGVVGWHSPNALALEGYYPSDSTEFLVIKDGVVSNAARYDDAETGIQDEFYYLVEADLNTGWMTQSEFDQSGWVEYIPDESPKGYIVVNSSGRIQHSVDLDDMFIHQIQHSVDVVNFYFTANGAAETENSELESGVDVTLYNADGTVADDALYDGAETLTYTQANGNMFEAADGGDLISLQSGALVMNPNADYKALSVQVEKAEDFIEVQYWANNLVINYQNSVTNSFSGTMSSSSIKNLYTDTSYTTTIPYVPSKRYQVGYYDNGKWVNQPSSLADMPAEVSYSSNFAVGFIPVDDGTGKLSIWFVTNYYGLVSNSFTSFRMRIYAKSVT